MATVIDTLFLELGIDTSKFSGEAAKAEKQQEKLEQAIAKTEDAEKNATKAANENAVARKKNAAEQKKADEQLQQLGKDIAVVARGFMAFTGMLLGASGLSKLAADAAKANVELDNAAKNLNMSRKELSAWKGAADMAGGSADGMAGYMQTLSGDIMNLVMMGDTSVLPYFNALGVSLLDSSGKARALDDVMLDLADRMSGMDRQQAYSLARQMGMDDGTANALMRGRQEMERMLAIQRDMYKSNEADIENARKLTEARAALNSQWEGLQLMIGNALIPVVTYLTEKVSAFVEYLVKNEHLTKGVFTGIATAISLFLLPLLAKAAIAMLGFIAPFLPAIIAATALGTAFGILYDDYKKWADGGKSLFDWGKFTQYINTSELSTKNLGKAFTYLLTGYTDWSTAANSLLDWLKLKGFIDANGVSVNSLITGFKNLASEIAQSLIPLFKAVSQWITKIAEGDFKGAWRDLEQGADALWEKIVDSGKAAINHIAGVADIATGHEVGALSNSIPDKAGKDSFSAMIGRGEGGYNSVNLGSKYGYKAGTRNLTDMTVAEVYAMQKRMEVNAVGKFQIIRDTMPEVIKGLGLTGKEKFNEEMQEKMGAWLLFNKRGQLGGYLKGKHSNRTLAGDEAAREWASLPVLSPILKTGKYTSKRGYTAYTDGVNRAGHKAEHLEKALDKAREMYRQAKVKGMSDSEAEVYAFRGVSSMKVLQPIGGAAAANLSANTRHIEAQKQAAQSAGQTVNKHTQVSVNNVTIQTTASNMSGSGSDFGNALAQRLDQLNYGMS